MTISLSAPMQSALKSAPDEWRSCSPTPTITALEKRGLVEIRTTPGHKGLMAGFQYRITESGREVDGREPEQKFNVDVWDNFNGDVVKSYFDVTADDLDDIREQYADEPLEVVATEAR